MYSSMYHYIISIHYIVYTIIIIIIILLVVLLPAKVPAGQNSTRDHSLKAAMAAVAEIPAKLIRIS